MALEHEVKQAVYELIAERARSRALAQEVERLRAAVEQIAGNIQGLGDGKQPNITEPARFYFRVVERICDAALSGSSAEE